MAKQSQIVRLRDFTGGVNLRDSGSELAPNDLAQTWNFTIDDAGGATVRPGYVQWGAAIAAAKVSNVFLWDNGANGGLGNLMSQVGLEIRKDAALAHTLTTSARVSFAVFGGKLCFVHPVDGLFTYDGAVVTAIAAGPKADSLAVWQGKLWTNDKSGTKPSQIHWCAIGDPTTWNVGDVNNIREVDEAQVVNVFSGQGQDIKGAPGLLVCKNGSTYRVNDSSTGAYTTLDSAIGAASNVSVVAVQGHIYILGPQGIFRTDGVSPLVSVSEKLGPVFPMTTDPSTLALCCAGTDKNRVFFCLPLDIGPGPPSANSVRIEHHPGRGWMMLRSDAASAFTFRPKDGAVLFGSPSVNGMVYQQTSTGLLWAGSDAGTAITVSLATSWRELNAGMRARLNCARVNGRGSFTLYPLYDYNLIQTVSRAVSLALGDNTTYGDYADLFNLGSGKAFAFAIQGSTSSTGFVPYPVQTPNFTSRQSGRIALYGLDLTAVPLGRT